MMRILTAVVALFLASCAGPQRLEGGAEIEPPYGYIKLCKEHPETAACKVTKP